MPAALPQAEIAKKLPLRRGFRPPRMVARLCSEEAKEQIPRASFDKLRMVSEKSNHEPVELQ